MTANDYVNVLVPAVTSLVKRINEINFLLVVDTEIKSFASADWMEDAILGLKNLGRWNRAALVKQFLLQMLLPISFRVNSKVLKKKHSKKLCDGYRAAADNIGDGIP
ncbi:hypothetical protein GCM10022250_30040 [Flavobacterium chungbukense]|uniref:Uncharacterized protein n=2 Tax=Flavobacterium chungbukense TaxID=877464 RepID=A0ABP7YED6_9FLAO